MSGECKGSFLIEITKQVKSSHDAIINRQARPKASTPQRGNAVPDAPASNINRLFPRWSVGTITNDGSKPPRLSVETNKPSHNLF